ncbi:MAG TPA: recombinase family protein [Acidimicrobiia bacterium]
MGTTAGVYVRISQDSTGERAGVTRQLEDCKAYLAQHGWALGAVYEDNSVSAYSGKPRPGYEALLAELEAGTINAVVCWHPDRLHRSTRELERFIDIVDATGAQVGTVNGGAYDLTTSTGRMAAKIVGAVAQAESEHKSERQRRANLQRAQQGRLHRGTRPFGLTFDGEHVETESEALRDVAAKLLAGRSLMSITRDLNAAGLTTTKGNAWTSAVLGRTFKSPYVGGQRTHHGEVIAEGQWAPIVDQLTWKRACAVLNQPGRNTATTNARKHLLPGFVFCGLCGSRLFSAVVNGKPGYSCKKDAMRTGCGRLTVVGAPLEALVRDAVIARVSESASISAALSAAVDDSAYSAAAAELAELAEQRAELDRARFIDGTLKDRNAYNRLALELDAKLEIAERRSTSSLGVVTMAGVQTDPVKLREQWDVAELDWRRSLIGAVVERIDVKPAKHKGQRFTPSRVDVHFRDAQQAEAS